jgi:hypothetical protein
MDRWMDGWRELSYLFWSAYIYRGGWALYCDGGVSEARRLFAMGSRRLVRGERVDGNVMRDMKMEMKQRESRSFVTFVVHNNLAKSLYYYVIQPFSTILLCNSTCDC